MKTKNSSKLLNPLSRRVSEAGDTQQLIRKQLSYSSFQVIIIFDTNVKHLQLLFRCYWDFVFLGVSLRVFYPDIVGFWANNNATLCDHHNCAIVISILIVTSVIIKIIDIIDNYDDSNDNHSMQYTHYYYYHHHHLSKLLTLINIIVSQVPFSYALDSKYTLIIYSRMEKMVVLR